MLKDKNSSRKEDPEEYISKAFEFLKKEEFFESKKYGEIAKIICENNRFTDTIEYLNSLLVIGHSFYNLKEYEQALSLYQQAQKLYLKIYDENTIENANLIISVANCHYFLNQYQKAIPFYQKAMEIFLNQSDEQKNVDWTLFYIKGECHFNLKEYEESLTLFKQAQKIYQKTNDINNSDYGTILQELANNYHLLGEPQIALPIYLEAQETYQKTIGKETVLYSGNLINIARCHKSMRQFQESLSVFIEAKKLYIKVNGEDIQYGEVLQDLARIYENMGDYQQALPLYLEVQQIFEELAPENKQISINNLLDLCALYGKLGRLDDAINLILKCKNNSFSEFGRNHECYIRSLQSLANIYKSMQRYSEAEKLLKEAIDIIPKIYEKQSKEYAAALNGLGLVYWGQEKLESAEKEYLKVKEILISINDEYNLALCNNNLALIYRDMGRYEEAEPLFLEAYLSSKQFIEGNNPNMIFLMNNLASCYVFTGKKEKALDLVKEAFILDNNILNQIFLVSNEKERTLFLENVEYGLDWYISFITIFFKDDNDAKKFCFDMVLKRKGIELEIQRAQQEEILAGENPKLAKKLHTLIEKRDILVQKTLNSFKTETQEDVIEELRIEKEKIESELAQEIPEIKLRKRLESVDRSMIKSFLSKNQALIEFVKYSPYRFGTDISSKERYLVFVMNSETLDDVHMIDLGYADIIDQEITSLRNQITGDYRSRGLTKNNEIPKSSSDKLETLVLNPILEVLEKDCDTLHIAPDGNIFLFPLEIISYKDAFLMDYYKINYLGTGRDIIRLEQEPGECSEPLIMVDPDFDYHKNYHDPHFNPKGSLSNDIQRKPLNFSRLPGTKLEGEKISRILNTPHIQFFMGSEAVETRLKTLKSPWILHLATHGFFLPDKESPENNKMNGRGLKFIGPGTENPLIRSGLAFAGANNHLEHLPKDAEDGIFTAEEACGLNLLHTEMVVLSACETGLGEVKNCEGVYGLRRAFVLAGARTLVMSLWNVDDLATTILMERFYQNLLNKKLGRNQSLKDAQRYLRSITISELKKDWLTEETIKNTPDMQQTLKFLIKKPDEHQPFKLPKFWGAFICQGDPSPLNMEKKA